MLGEHGLDDVLTTIDAYLKELRPGIVVIDSFRAFHAFAKDMIDFRRFLYGLSRRLARGRHDLVWNAPYTREQALEVAGVCGRRRDHRAGRQAGRRA